MFPAVVSSYPPMPAVLAKDVNIPSHELFDDGRFSISKHKKALQKINSIHKQNCPKQTAYRARCLRRAGFAWFRKRAGEREDVT